MRSLPLDDRCSGRRPRRIAPATPPHPAPVRCAAFIAMPLLRRLQAPVPIITSRPKTPAGPGLDDRAPASVHTFRQNGATDAARRLRFWSACLCIAGWICSRFAPVYVPVDLVYHPESDQSRVNRDVIEVGAAARRRPGEPCAGLFCPGLCWRPLRPGSPRSSMCPLTSAASHAG